MDEAQFQKLKAQFYAAQRAYNERLEDVNCCRKDFESGPSDDGNACYYATSLDQLSDLVYTYQRAAIPAASSR